MLLEPGGIDVFYIDESFDGKLHVVTAIAIPMLRPIDKQWVIAWPDHFEGAKRWRQRMRDKHHIPVAKELHASRLAAGGGNYLYGQKSFGRPKARGVFGAILRDVDFVPVGSVISAANRKGTSLYGQTELPAAIHALFQRMRRQCVDRKVNAITFFDEGNADYRMGYRRAQVYLPTGSMVGGWSGGSATQNLPLSMFFKDANEKRSRFCWFTQLADLIAFAVFSKVRSEFNELTDWQRDLGYANLYDELPTEIKNVRAQNKGPKDGIVRLWL
jgi:hypothetical protein